MLWEEGFKNFLLCLTRRVYLILSVLFLLLLIPICFITGLKILKLFKIRFSSHLEEFVFSTGIGLGIVGYLVLLLGVIGFLYKWLCLVLFAILFCLVVWELIKARNTISKFVHGLSVDFLLRNTKYDRFKQSLLAILALYFILSFVSSLAPPMDVDSLVYHLSIPKHWIQNHKVVYIPSILPSELPLTVETLYTLGMILTNDVSAGLIVWAYSLLFALAILSFCREYFSAKVGILAAAAFCCTPFFGSISVRTFVDIATGFYAFLGLYAFLKYVNIDDYKWLMLGCITSGISAATKHSGVIPFVVLSIAIAIVEIKRRKLTIKSIQRIILCYLVFILVPMPWYIKSFINTGNPTVIYFTHFFGGRDLLPEDMSNTIISWRSTYSFKSTNWLKMFLLPFILLLNAFFIDIRYWLVGQFILAFLPILSIMKKNKNVIYLLIYSFILLILYSIVTNQTRLAIPVFAGLFIASAYSAYRILDSNIILKNVIQIIIIISLFFNMIPLVQDVSEKYKVAIGLETREQYLERRVNVYSAIDFANRNLGDDVKIMTMDSRGYHFDKPYLVGAKLYQGYITFSGINDLHQLLSMFQSYGITHILTQEDTGKSEIPFWNKLKTDMTLLYFKNGYYLYKL
jgi:hypothetical protein